MNDFKILNFLKNYIAGIMTFILLLYKNDLLVVVVFIMVTSLLYLIAYGLYHICIASTKDVYENKHQLLNRVFDDMNGILSNNMKSFLIGIGVYMLVSYFLR